MLLLCALKIGASTLLVLQICLVILGRFGSHGWSTLCIGRAVSKFLFVAAACAEFSRETLGYIYEVK